MCGICGIVHSDNNKRSDEAVLRRMNETLHHRGPDGEGYYCDKGVGLGMKRLSIIDLTTGDQPIFNEDKTIAVVCNGEIYNYIEVRAALINKGHRFSTNSDVEVIVHLYEEYGVDCMHHLRGMFGFALWDKKERHVLLVRDRMGIKPLNYALSKDGSLYFGSEYKAILASGAIEKIADPHAIHDLFTYGYVLSPKTMFKTIRRLLPGHYIIFKDGRITERQYWDIDFPRNGAVPARTIEEWAECVYEKLKESVRIHLRSDVPVSAWLSAGIDSSSIVALTRQIRGEAVQTFSMTFDGRHHVDEIARVRTLDQYPGFDIPNERLVCSGEHFNLYPRMLWFQEDPTTSGVPIVQTLLAEATVKKYKVVMTGEGSDEFFAGYPWYRFNMLARPFSFLPRSVRSAMIIAPLIRPWKELSTQIFLAPHAMGLLRYAHLIGLYFPERLKSLYSGDLSAVLRDTGDDLPSHLRPLEQAREWDDLSRLQYIEDKTRLSDLITHNLDRSSMANSLELRVPFLDHEFVELTLQIPSALKLRRHKEKYILREAMRPYLPAEIVERKKFGLNTPTSTWFREKLPAFAEEMLSRASIKRKGYFDPLAVENMLKDHRARRSDLSRPLIAALGVQVWDEIFMNDRRMSA